MLPTTQHVLLFLLGVPGVCPLRKSCFVNMGLGGDVYLIQIMIVEWTSCCARCAPVPFGPGPVWAHALSLSINVVFVFIYLER